MTQSATTLSFKQAKSIIIEHVRAWIMPYEPINSQEFNSYLTLAPALMDNPEADLDELCATIID